METIKTKDYINKEKIEAIKQIQESDNILKLHLYNQNRNKLEVYELEAKTKPIAEFKREEIQTQNDFAAYIYKSNKSPDPLLETANGDKDIFPSVLYDKPDCYSRGFGISNFSYISSLDEKISNMMLEEYCKTPFPFMGSMHLIEEPYHMHDPYAEFCPMLLEHSNITKGYGYDYILWGPLIRYNGYDDYFTSIRLGKDDEGADKHAWMIKSLTPMLYNLENFMNQNFQNIDAKDMKTILELYNFNGLVQTINMDEIEKLVNYRIAKVKKPIAKKVSNSQKVLSLVKRT